MPGRPIPSEAELVARGWGREDVAQRRAVLRETLAAFAAAAPPDRYHSLAARNLEHWRVGRQVPVPSGEVQVLAGDWGEVTRQLTAAHGECFAVLNMANAYVPGGAYVEGAIAQEENIFRRTDCQFHVGPAEYDESTDRYWPDMTALLSAKNGVVYLDDQNPRVCIRGPEDRARDDLGYPWLADDQIFPFYELRASAQDLRGGVPFDREEARRRIAAQLDTLRAKKVRYAVLGAFGCGAFENPSQEVAALYREELEKRRTDFALIAFAIFAAGYGPENYQPFANEFGS